MTLIIRASVQKEEKETGINTTLILWDIFMMFQKHEKI